MVRPRYRADRALPHPYLRAGIFHDRRAALTAVRIAAGLVWPVSSPPIARGAVLVGDDGRIQEVGPDDAVPRPVGAATFDFPAGILLPGLVNAHSHLELTHLSGQVSDPDFCEWIQHIRRAKADTPPADFVSAAKRGIEEGWRRGITTVADTGDTRAAAVALKELGASGVIYQEVFGPHPDQLDSAMSGLRQNVQRLRQLQTSRIRVGVSPHAPYTVSGPLFQAVARYAASEGLPLALHLAESRAETAFVTSASGPFANLWTRRQIPLPPPVESPVAYVESLGVLGPETLVIHAVQTSVRDCTRLAESGCSIVLCPRSNHAHGHGWPPAAAYLAAGIRVGLGTDSAASVASPDLFAEARVLRESTPIDDAVVIELLTLGGARAIGLDRETGSLQPGKWGDCCVLGVPGTIARPADAARKALASGAVQATWVAGRRVH